MSYKYFNWEEVVAAMETDGYYIHTHTNPAGRDEASRLCEDLKEYFNDSFDEDDDKIIFINSEVPPACDYGIIKRSDEFEMEEIRDIDNIKELKKAIEKNRIEKDG